MENPYILFLVNCFDLNEVFTDKLNFPHAEFSNLIQYFTYGGKNATHLACH